MKVLVTGSNGFIGAPLVAALEANGDAVVRVVRRATSAQEVAIENIDDYAHWPAQLSGVEAVVHLAARVHDLHATQDQLELYRRTNTQATLTLAREAQKAGVKRFVFISTLYRSRKITDAAVAMDGTNIPYRETDIPTPDDAYGISKWEAEQGLQAMMGGAMEIVIVRPPLVYGSQVRANFLRLLKLAASGLPLPLGAIRNQRSMIYIGNLVDAIMLCVRHPNARNQAYLVADGEALSVPHLLRTLGVMMQRPVRLLPLPKWALRVLGRLTGRIKDVERLTESLTVDSTKIRKQLGWIPPFTVQQGLEETVRWYQKERAA
jgi:nucleoside-diphosphate-sugar epimerase